MTSRWLGASTVSLTGTKLTMVLTILTFAKSTVATGLIGWVVCWVIVQTNKERWVHLPYPSIRRTRDQQHGSYIWACAVCNP